MKLHVCCSDLFAVGLAIFVLSCRARCFAHADKSALSAQSHMEEGGSRCLYESMIPGKGKLIVTMKGYALVKICC